MSREAARALDRLGPEGLERVLDDVFDTVRLARLANACGVSYPGMRTRTQSRRRLLADLARRASEDSAAAREVVRQLRKETAGHAKTWAKEDPVELGRRWADPSFEPRNGEVGAAAFAVAARIVGVELDVLPKLLERPVAKHDRRRASATRRDTATRDVESATGPSKDVSRLERRLEEHQRKIRHQNERLRKSRETERALRRDLMERRGELAESRMTVERLRKELESARDAPDPREQESEMVRGLETLTRAVRRIGTRQNKLSEAVETLSTTIAAVDDTESADVRIAELAASTEAIAKELASHRRSVRRFERETASRLDSIVERITEVVGRVEQLDAAKPARRAARGKPRVGVFIDVQNVFYGARQLKGKLDFDALMEAAVRGRRLVLAQAYVVESKDTDQSGFIAVLEHRSIRVRRKNLQVRADGSMKGDWDMEIALDILDATSDLDVVVLVSGDGDFASLVRRVKGIGPRVEVLSFPRTTAKALIEAADHFQPLDRRFMIRATENGPRSRGRVAESATDRSPGNVRKRLES